MNSVTKLTLSLIGPISFSQKCTEFKKYSRVTTAMFQGWLMWVAVLKVASACRISFILLKSFLQESESLSLDVLADLSASGDSLVIEISFAPGLCRSDQTWLLIWPLRPTPSES